jgi:hypothetical protein
MVLRFAMPLQIAIIVVSVAGEHIGSPVQCVWLCGVGHVDDGLREAA